MLFAAIYVPDFVAASLVRAAPELRAQPLAVLEGAPPLVRVGAVNEAARQAGVEVGMTRLQAEALAGLAVRRRAAAQEAAAHAALRDGAHAFSPRVEPLARDTVLLDVSGLERLFGPPPRLARELARHAAALGLEANVALAANREAAVHAACGFSGVTVIPPGEEAQRLGPLPVEVLFRVPSPESRGAGRNAQLDTRNAVLSTFDAWGVHTLRALAALPSVAVAERLGQRGVAWQKLARGEGSQVLVAAEPPLRFEEALALEHPVDQIEPLAFLLARLLAQLCARLAARALATNELRLTLELEAIEPLRDRVIESLQSKASADSPESLNDSMAQSLNFQRTLRLPVPMLDARVFLKLWQLDLQEHPPAAPIRKITLAAEPVRPQVVQHGLFHPTTPEPEKLQLLLARLAGIVGAGNAGSPALRDAHRREAFVVREFANCRTAELPNCRTANGDAQNSAIPQFRNAAMATRVFRPAIAATIEVHDGRPVRLACADERGFTGDVVWAAGPWRASGEWWGEQVSGPAPRVSRPDRKAFPLRQAPVQEVNPGGYQYSRHPARLTSAAGARPSAAGRVTKNAEAETALGFSRDEWDIAVAPRRKKPIAGHSPANEPPQPALVLYRLVHELASGRWLVEGQYD